MLCETLQKCVKCNYTQLYLKHLGILSYIREIVIFQMTDHYYFVDISGIGYDLCVWGFAIHSVLPINDNRNFGGLSSQDLMIVINTISELFMEWWS